MKYFIMLLLLAGCIKEATSIINPEWKCILLTYGPESGNKIYKCDLGEDYCYLSVGYHASGLSCFHKVEKSK